MSPGGQLLMMFLIRGPAAEPTPTKATAVATRPELNRAMLIPTVATDTRTALRRRPTSNEVLEVGTCWWLQQAAAATRPLLAPDHPRAQRICRAPQCMSQVVTSPTSD